jgi:HSP20 family molecular chaperone IbpA
MANNAQELRNQLNSLLGEEVVNEFFNQVSNITETVRQQVPIEIRRRPRRRDRSNRQNSSNTPSVASDWPLMNVVEHKDRISVSAEVPGINPDNITLELKDNFLVMRGSRDPEPPSSDGERRHLYERRYGSFYRTVPVYVGVNQEEVRAGYTNGVLTVTVPKPPESDVHRIPIRVSVNESEPQSQEQGDDDDIDGENGSASLT